MPANGPWRFRTVADEELVCTCSINDAPPNLMICSLVLWVGWWSKPGPVVRSRIDLTIAVTNYLNEQAALEGEPVNQVENRNSAEWLIERTLGISGTPLRRLA